MLGSNHQSQNRSNPEQSNSVRAWSEIAAERENASSDNAHVARDDSPGEPARNDPVAAITHRTSDVASSLWSLLSMRRSRTSIDSEEDESNQPMNAEEYSPVDDDDGDYVPSEGERSSDEYASSEGGSTYFLSQTLSRNRLSPITAERSLRASKKLQADCKLNGQKLLHSGEFVQFRDPILLESLTSAWQHPVPGTPDDTTCCNTISSPGNSQRPSHKPSTVPRSTSHHGKSKTSSPSKMAKLQNPHDPYVRINPVSLMRARELGGCVGQRLTVTDASSRYIPNTCGEPALTYSERPYSGQFSKDGNLFYSCTQDFKVHLYDSSDPYRLHEYKTVRAPSGQWTITDVSLSHDSSFLVYSSISPRIHLTSSDKELEEQHMLDLSKLPSQKSNRDFGVWSVRISADGREVVAGTSSNCVYVYDIEHGQVVMAVRGHADDVNAVCFGDKSTNLLYSGSDDSLIKVWDRRSLNADAKPVGVLPGHTEGITYVSAREDGRYCVSNSKDQSAKLWDVRRLVEPNQFNSWPAEHRDRRIDWDYRYQAYPLGLMGPATNPHPRDASVVTMMGHSVLVTLIRVHFDPVSATHIVSGSRDGTVRIYDMLGQCVQELSTHQRNGNGRRPGGSFRDDDDAAASQLWESVYGWRRELVVRDVAWHPQLPIIMSTSWTVNGGAILRHSYNANSV